MIFEILFALILGFVPNVVLGGQGSLGYRSNYLCYKWINKHVPITKPVALCGRQDLTWKYAHQSCEDQNLQLCYGQQVCPHFQRENRFAVEPSVEQLMIPVANGYNQWVSNQYDGNMCDLFVDVTNGDVKVTRSWKQSFYCCPKCDLRRFWAGHTITWDQANNFCKRQTMRERWQHRFEVQRDIVENDPYQMHLCSSDEVCKGDKPRWMQRTRDSSMWTPVSDSPNEWVQMAPSSGDRCQKYTSEFGGNKPAWGQDDSCEHPWRGYVFCCGVQPRHMGPHYYSPHQSHSNDEASATGTDVQDGPVDDANHAVNGVKSQVYYFTETNAEDRASGSVVGGAHGTAEQFSETVYKMDPQPWYASSDEQEEFNRQAKEDDEK